MWSMWRRHDKSQTGEVVDGEMAPCCQGMMVRHDEHQWVGRQQRCMEVVGHCVENADAEVRSAGSACCEQSVGVAVDQFERWGGRVGVVVVAEDLVNEVAE